MTKSDDDPMNVAIEKFTPTLKEMGFGSFAGYCSGAAAKKIGKAVAVALGLAYIALQGMVSTGFVEVDWNKMQEAAIKKIDTTGDGQLDADDLKVYWKKVKKILTNKIPSAGGFSIGFLYGISSN